MTTNKMLQRFRWQFIFRRKHQSPRLFAPGFCINLLSRAGAPDDCRKRLDFVPTFPSLQPQGSFCPVNRPIFFFPHRHQVKDRRQILIDRKPIMLPAGFPPSLMHSNQIVA
jgi:hypothetical protein